MRPKIGAYIAIAIGVAVAIGIFGTQNDGEIEIIENRVFHVTLTSPENYENGVYTEKFLIEKGDYEFSFVPNGDSPEIMTISLNGESFSFNENFDLVGTPHETGVSTYFTWDYSGTKNIQILKQQDIEITIDPNGNLLGPVSVDIIRK